MTTPSAAKTAAAARTATAAKTATPVKPAAAVSLANGLAIAALVVSVLSMLGTAWAWFRRHADAKRIEDLKKEAAKDLEEFKGDMRREETKHAEKVKGEVSKELETFKGDIRRAEAEHVEKVKGDIRRDVEENLKAHESRLRLNLEMQLRRHERSWELLRQTVEAAFETQLLVRNIAHATGPLDRWDERMSAFKKLIGLVVVAPPAYDLMGLLTPFFEAEPEKFLTDKAEVEKATKGVAQVLVACQRWNKDLWAETARLEGANESPAPELGGHAPT